MSERYNIRETEQKWQRTWEEEGAFKVEIDPSKPKYYVLEMLPYPSGRIHMGHVSNYSIGDLTARFKKAQGFNVLHPMGWDSFGLPAENAAIEHDAHPAKWTRENIADMRDQLKSIGLSYDWSREISTCEPDYYKHEQKMFIDFYNKGLAYQKESVVNWDPVENTVLANEQVVDGKGWRSGVPVERRKLHQWFLKTTDYVEELLNNLETLTEWPDKVRTMQKNWIGKSSGALIHFKIEGQEEALTVFTTRPDTIFGASFCAIAADHPLAEKLKEADPKLGAFIEECNRIGTSEAAIEQAEKLGYDTGLKAVHPFDPTWELPVYVANFVLMDYGTGAVFGVPAHDQRDLDFANKYDLPVRIVVAPKNKPADFDVTTEAFTEDGVLVNSDFLDGLNVANAKKTAIAKLQDTGQGEEQTTYRLRDWGVSRQRYWGCPVPMIHCDDCGVVPVPEDQLPVTLPDDVDFSKPGNPLDRHPTWKNTTCPSCSKGAVRETDTFDTFFESSWYFARYCSPNSDQPIDRTAADYWLPIDQYIGGVEHATMHLMYFRFFTMAMRDCGYWGLTEPASRLLNQGMVTHETYKAPDGKWLYPEDTFKDEDGQIKTIADKKPVTVGRSIKMSKSKKNVVDPRQIIREYGADTARLFMLSDSPPDRDLIWSEGSVEGAWRYVNRIHRIFTDAMTHCSDADLSLLDQAQDKALDLRKLTHKSIELITKDFADFHFNKAIARLREFSNGFDGFKPQTETDKAALKEALLSFLQLIAPVIPHLCEELWQQMEQDGLICNAPWPKANPSLVVEDTVTMAVQINGKLRTTIELPMNTAREEAEKLALSQPQIVKFIEEKEPRKVIVVPNKIVNVVL